MDPKRQIPAQRTPGTHPFRIEGDLGQSLDRLKVFLQDRCPMALAVSGGLDSRLLAFLARGWGLDVHCLHFKGPHLPPDETVAAIRWLEQLGLPFMVVAVNPLETAQVKANTRRRCYHCKRALFEAAKQTELHRPLMDGTNASDLGEYRPGLQALQELGVISPFARLGIPKDGIRALARMVGLDRPDQPSAPCLLTRIPYDMPIRESDLQRIAALEEACRKAGFEDFRVRLLADGPMLFANTRHQALILPPQIEVQWVDQVSGYWDTKEKEES